jgi:hypothetical protein
MIRMIGLDFDSYEARENGDKFTPAHTHVRVSVTFDNDAEALAFHALVVNLLKEFQAASRAPHDG